MGTLSTSRCIAKDLFADFSLFHDNRFEIIERRGDGTRYAGTG